MRLTISDPVAFRVPQYWCHKRIEPLGYFGLEAVIRCTRHERPLCGQNSRSLHGRTSNLMYSIAARQLTKFSSVTAHLLAVRQIIAFILGLMFRGAV